MPFFKIIFSLFCHPWTIFYDLGVKMIRKNVAFFQTELYRQPYTRVFLNIPLREKYSLMKSEFFFFFLFMSDAHHGINSSTQKYQGTQSNVALTSCRQDSGSPPFWSRPSSLEMECIQVENSRCGLLMEQKISCGWLGWNEVFGQQSHAI